MRKHGSIRIGLTLALAAAVAAGCREGGKPAPGAGATGSDPAVARVGSKTLHESDVADVLTQVPQQRQSEFSTGRGKLRLIQSMVDRELMVRAATDAKLDRDPTVVKQLEQIRSGLLVQAYQKQMVDALPKPTEEQLRKYYDEHPQEFIVQARVNASWIVCNTKAAADRARQRVVVRGEDFGKVAAEASVDQATAKDGGLLGYFNPVGYVRGIGNRPEFAPHAFALEAGDVGEVFPWDGKWAFIKVHEKNTERADSYERAKERIQGRLTPTLTDSLVQSNLATLRQKYKVDILFDASSELKDKSAEDIMRLATEAPNPQDKVEYYQALLERFPKYERADEAQFMIGFVYSEELQDFAKAKPAYEKVISNYPGSSIAESARYMLQNMGHGAMPQFEEPGGVQGVQPPAGH
jgi:peptidyl-prolyl cis-trans isomerase C